MAMAYSNSGFAATLCLMWAFCVVVASSAIISSRQHQLDMSKTKSAYPGDLKTLAILTYACRT